LEPIKASRECLGCNFPREVNRDNDRIFVLIVFEPRSFVPVAIEPFAHRGHLTRKIRPAHPDLDGSHGTLSSQDDRGTPYFMRGGLPIGRSIALATAT
jgi:hypothetical protein